MKYKIAITGAGGGVGQSIIKSLQHTDYELVALDGEPLGAGLYWCKTSYVIPYCTSPDYIDVLLDICLKENIAILFPGLDFELDILSKNVDRFDEIGTKVIVSSPEVIEIANNKWKTYEHLSKASINLPKTIPMTPTIPSDLSFPVVIKQKLDGAGSKNVFVVKNLIDFDYQANKLNPDKFILQEFIDGDEYTCGTVSLDGEYYGCIVMRRILRDGDTYKAFVEKNPVIEEYVKSIVEYIKPYGACNIQLRVKDKVPYLLEINARCSGTTASRTLCGFNEPKMICDYILKDISPTYNIEEIVILRYWNELVTNYQYLNTLKTTKTLKQSV